jgi:ribosome-binding protein aMBF1 (putative translation factor)
MNTTGTITLQPQEVQQRRKRLGWSQNELARRINKDPGLVSRVLRGKATSSIVWGRIVRVLLREESRRVRHDPSS